MLIFLYSKDIQLYIYIYIYLFSYSFPFCRLEYWSGLLFPSPGDLPNTGIKPWSPALQADSLPSEPLVTHTYRETLTVESWKRRQELGTAKVKAEEKKSMGWRGYTQSRKQCGLTAGWDGGKVRKVSGEGWKISRGRINEELTSSRNHGSLSKFVVLFVTENRLLNENLASDFYSSQST